MPNHPPKESDKNITTISIIVPAYNEEEVILALYERIKSVTKELPYNFRLVFINDGSKDHTAEIITQLSENDPQVELINLSRNFGKEIAMSAGLDHATGEAVIIIDADLQDPPELIPELLEMWRAGNDVVYAKRISRDGESLLKKITAYLFYRTIKKIGHVEIPADTGDFRLLSRPAIDALKSLREHHRFMKGLFAWIGYKQTAIPYHRDRRFAGSTKWNYWKLWNFALEGITSFTTAPLKIATYFGLTVAALSFIYGIWMIVHTLIHGNPVPGYPSLMVVILFLGGVQLIALGVIGEYLGRMFDETKQRPLYLISEHINPPSPHHKE
ncbi:glycosyltransferase family 2 protein [Ectothiorhodospira lacustris]|uniref:glycosyltransferase family 2 protein n=1 Tax=Ectothiorhodospira lacustris TaxID=2899127 RepID=UPI001EE891F5|nr:glycosyltransferase family 2 protein [Ectothiorhodospira lacustris]MCG5510353.1 glycosyltransferase family 2 protein [Ectothiorhodospira lacustris]MCG5522099.1 glycosyltransferase family 2 protein [Ectothiorhodospira lacustris]